MVTTTGPWATPGDPERLSLESWSGTGGLVRFIDSAHADVLVVLTDDARERMGLLRDGIGQKNLRHDNLARIVWYSLLAHEYMHGDTPAGRDIVDVRSALFPDDLKIVHASYRESAGRAAARTALLTSARSLVLANIPVQGSNLLVLTHEWNHVERIHLGETRGLLGYIESMVQDLADDHPEIELSIDIPSQGRSRGPGQDPGSATRAGEYTRRVVEGLEQWPTYPC